MTHTCRLCNLPTTTRDLVDAALVAGSSSAALRAAEAAGVVTSTRSLRRHRAHTTTAPVQDPVEGAGSSQDGPEGDGWSQAQVGGDDDLYETFDRDPVVWELTRVGYSQLTGTDGVERTWVKPTFALRSPDSETVTRAVPSLVTVTPSALPHRPRHGRWAVITPDMQIPFTDWAAVDITEQIAADLQAEHGIDDWVDLGDMADLPELSTHRTAPGAMRGISLAAQMCHDTWARRRALAPDARLVWVEGNHEARMRNWLADRAPQLLGMRRAGEQGPVVSLPYLANLDAIPGGVEWVGPYPTGHLYLNDHLRVIHGTHAKPAKGATAAQYLATATESVIYGHIHRAELVYQTRHTARGPRTYMAGSPGCLCRLDGQVPSYWASITDTGGQASARLEDWQQGLWVVWYETTGRQLYTVEPIHIWGGRAHWRGREYVARCDVDGNPLVVAA